MWCANVWCRFQGTPSKNPNPGLKPWAMVYSRFAAESDRHLCYDIQPLRDKFGGGRFLVAAAPISEEILQKLPAFGLADTGSNQATMIQLRHLQKIDHAAGSASFRIRAAEDHPT